MDVKVVKYAGSYFLWWKTNEAGFAQLIDTSGNKWPGTPLPTNITIVKTIPCIEFNKCWYFKTKAGVFSATSGNKIINDKILELF